MKIVNKASLVLLAFAFTLSLVGLVKAAHPTVNLGTTADFAILAGTGITNVPTSTITGNVGLSPTTGAAMTGLTCAEVTGTIYDVDGTFPGACEVTNAPLLTTAKNDLVTAYDDAAGRTPVTTINTELGGQTITDGVYSSASTTFEITAGAGPLILDGQGNPDSVFIFIMNSGATGLTVGPGSTVSLVNSAQACNVFWKLNTASIDTTAVFKGTSLALTSITVANGANIEGRLLARNGNVTLISDTITKPVCTASTTPPPSPGTPAPGTPAPGTPAPGAPGSSPELPNAGVAPDQRSIHWNIVIPAGIFTVLTWLALARKKENRLAARVFDRFSPVMISRECMKSK